MRTFMLITFYNIEQWIPKSRFPFCQYGTSDKFSLSVFVCSVYFCYCYFVFNSSMTLVQKILNPIVGVDTKVTGDYTGYKSMM